MADDIKILISPELEPGSKNKLKESIQSAINSGTYNIELNINVKSLEQQTKKIRKLLQDNFTSQGSYGQSTNNTQRIKEDTAGYKAQQEVLKQNLKIKRELDNVIGKKGKYNPDVYERQFQNARVSGDSNLASLKEDVKKKLSTLQTAASNIKGKEIDLSPNKYEAYAAALADANISIRDFEQARRMLSQDKSFSNTLNKDMISAKNLVNEMDRYFSKNTKFRENSRLSKNADDIYSQINKITAKGVHITADDAGTIKELRQKFALLKHEINQAGLAGQSLGDKLKKELSKLGVYLSASTIALAAVNQIKKMIDSVTKLDSSLTQLAIVSNASTNSLADYFKDASVAAKEVGRNIADIIDSTTTFRRLGFSVDDSLELASQTAKYSTAGDVESNVATDNITAIVKGFKIDVKDLNQVLDEMVYTGNNYAISASQLGDGLQNAGSALSAAGNTVQQAMAMMTAATTDTQDVNKSSTGLRTIAARIRNSSTELEELGEELDSSYNTTAKYRKQLEALTGVDILQSDEKTFKSTYDIIREIADVWDELSDLDQSSVTNMIAGVRQQNVFASLINNFKDAKSIMGDTEKATGTLEKANSKYLDSIQGKSEQFTATFQKLSNTVIDSSFVKDVIDGGTSILDILNSLCETLGTLPTLAMAAAAAFSVFGNKGWPQKYRKGYKYAQPLLKEFCF